MHSSLVQEVFAAVVASTLSGCALTPAYSWHPAAAPSQRVEWAVVSPEALLSHCGPAQARGWVRTVACAVQVRESGVCYVFSYLTEEQARVTYDLDGEAIHDHEMRHCRGWRH